MDYTNKEFENILKESRKIVADSKFNECPCTQECEWHGKCFECVKIHRVKGKHIPECLHFIFEKKVNDLAQCIERKLSDDRPKIIDRK